MRAPLRPKQHAPRVRSTTIERDVAMGYAAGDGERMGIVLEMRQGMVDRGADISWLSQVPASPAPVPSLTPRAARL